MTDPRARARITEAAEGNPLFLEQMVAMLADDPEDASAIAIPPSIQALLAARLDQLDRVERDVIERAAVVGREFSRAAVSALAPPELLAPLPGALMALVRKQMLVPETSGAGQDDVFRFGHILIRDAAYEAVPKKVRGEHHEQLAHWLDGWNAEATEEIVGFHLEQAYLARSGLGQPDEKLAALASRAGRLLASAGRRALGRDDFAAASSLLERAAALFDQADPEHRGAVIIDLGLALRESGQLEAADRSFAAAEGASGDRLRYRALVERSSLRAFVDPGVETDELLRVANQAIGVFESSEDDLGLAQAWLLVAEVQWLRCHCAEMEEVLARALLHAERAGERREISSILEVMAPAALVGPRPVADAIEVCRGILERGHGSAGVEGHVNLVMAVLEAMMDRLEEARRLYTDATRILEDRGLTTFLASLRMYPGMVELIGGDYESAERGAEAGLRRARSRRPQRLSLHDGGFPRQAALRARPPRRSAGDDTSQSGRGLAGRHRLSGDLARNAREDPGAPRRPGDRYRARERSCEAVKGDGSREYPSRRLFGSCGNDEADFPGTTRRPRLRPAHSSFTPRRATSRPPRQWFRLERSLTGGRQHDRVLGEGGHQPPEGAAGAGRARRSKKPAAKRSPEEQAFCPGGALRARDRGGDCVTAGPDPSAGS